MKLKKGEKGRACDDALKGRVKRRNEQEGISQQRLPVTGNSQWRGCLLKTEREIERLIMRKVFFSEGQRFKLDH